MKAKDGSLNWFARPTFSMLTGEPGLYSRYSDGIILEASHFLLRKRSLLRFFHGKIFAIDPRTPIFQAMNRCFYDQRTERIRTSYLKLAKLHGEPFVGKFLEDIPVSPEDFSPDVCKRISSEVMELENSADPQILLPPYFVIEGSSDPWFEVGLRIYEEMSAYASNVYLPLAISRQLLGDIDGLKSICHELSRKDIPGFAIWPVGFDEFNSTLSELMGLEYLLDSLPETRVLLYAGYFSILLCAITGASFSNGPCFHEKRDMTIAPPLEFRPRCRYYLPLLRQKVDPVAALVFYRTLADLGIRPGLCEACERNTLGNGYEGIAEMPEIDIYEHNFISRRREVDELSNSRDPFDLGLEDLRSLLDIQKDLSHFRSMKHLTTWIDALEKLSTKAHNRY
ncbi:MAG: hypothetical protein HXS50_00750 [Theionarchaea archaeon]|nr:hypothetical protein [Theionarchaea archaeon]